MSRYTSSHTGAQIDSAVSAVPGKQDRLTTYTAYTVGNANKLISITTNTLGQVIAANEYELIKDCGSTAVVTINAASWENLKSNHSITTIPDPSFAPLSVDFVRATVSINSQSYTLLLTNQDSSGSNYAYTGLFFIEETENETDHLYELSIYIKSSTLVLRCATVY